MAHANGPEKFKHLAQLNFVCHARQSIYVMPRVCPTVLRCSVPLYTTVSTLYTYIMHPATGYY